MKRLVPARLRWRRERQMNEKPAAIDATAAQARTMLWILLIVYIFNFLDRQIVNILAEPIKADLKLSDTQLGLLAGPAFAVFYALLGIPIARSADKDRKSTRLNSSH